LSQPVVAVEVLIPTLQILPLIMVKMVVLVVEVHLEMAPTQLLQAGLEIRHQLLHHKEMMVE
jgi:hypothetical protein